MMMKKSRNNLFFFFKYRELLFNLTYREIAQRYKQSVLGYAWVIINPLSQLIVLTFVFSTVLKIPSLGVPFIIFLAIGLLPWNLFTQSLSTSTGALISHSNLITKIYFPREILIYSAILAKIVDFIFACLIIIFFLFIFKVKVTLMFLWVPAIFFVQLLFMTGLSLISAAFNLFYRDIQYLLQLMLLLWMYVTPIMYPVELIPDRFRFALSLNPMSVIVNAYRQVILAGKPPNFQSLLIGLITSLIVFLLGFVIFKKLEGQFADYV
ncbi:MAG TPA: ABC transporter permease [Patescibacteria group bacterium]|nr:ABC transporter permease [Patescibacteria group bacterium]